MTKKRETGGHVGTTDRVLSKLSYMMLGREQGQLKKDGTKRPAQEGTDDVKDMATLANAYGYLLNVQTNVMKTVVFAKRLAELEEFAMKTERLMPDVRKSTRIIPQIR